MVIMTDIRNLINSREKIFKFIISFTFVIITFFIVFLDRISIKNKNRNTK